MTRIHALLGATLIATLACSASASPVQIQSQDLPLACDVLAPLPAVMDELGTTAVFPADEFITAVATTVMPDACATSSSPAIPNALLSITNNTTISFVDLHYVADPGTGFTNFDGTINTFEAVKLDTVGVNRPLVSEVGGSTALVFEPGETWNVILDDWGNGSGLTAADLGSIGVPSFPIPGAPDLSSGSIVANILPEPGTFALIGLGVAAIFRRTRTNH